MEASELNDKYACAELIQAWGFYRDQGKWPQLLATFAPDGQIAVSWFSGGFPEFVDRCRRGFDAGQRSKHHVFPSVVRLAGERALAETNIVILVRQNIGGVLADLTSYARFLDRLERTDGRWHIVERTAIYERDRLDPVEPSENFDRLFKSGDLWPRGSLLPAARLLPSSIATAPRIRRNCTCAMTLGLTEDKRGAAQVSPLNVLFSAASARSATKASLGALA